jgi:hypothetical protein
MDEQAFQRSLRAFCRRRPFRPFLIELFSGDRLLVVHPEAVTSFGTLVYFVETDNRARLFQSSSICQLLDVPV